MLLGIWLLQGSGAATRGRLAKELKTSEQNDVRGVAETRRLPFISPLQDSRKPRAKSLVFCLCLGRDSCLQDVSRQGARFSSVKRPTFHPERNHVLRCPPFRFCQVVTASHRWPFCVKPFPRVQRVHSSQ